MIGALPTVDEHLRWLPVDIAARSLVEVLTSSNSEPGVYNLVNPQTLHWTKDLLPLLRQAGMQFESLKPTAWLQRLRSSNQDPSQNPPIKLLEYFEAQYNSDEPRSGFAWNTEKAQAASVALRSSLAPGEELVGRVVRYLKERHWAGTNEVAAPNC